MRDTTSTIDVLLPVHNEGETIEETIGEIYSRVSAVAPARLIVCEDGSVDQTREVLERLKRRLPMKLLTSPKRKGYSRAVIDGMARLDAGYLLCLDADGQCDPADLERFWPHRVDADVLVGSRVKRRDHFFRRAASRLFYAIYKLLFKVPVHDPSCPFVLARRSVIETLRPELGAMEQGFWWEFVARAHRRGYKLMEIPVNHRARAAGETQVYQLRKIPGIGWRHLVALFRIWFQTRSASADSGTYRR
jgi:glycosyltransferase involved in cell wall biosynthesis